MKEPRGSSAGFMQPVYNTHKLSIYRQISAILALEVKLKISNKDMLQIV